MPLVLRSEINGVLFPYDINMAALAHVTTLDFATMLPIKQGSVAAVNTIALDMSKAAAVHATAEAAQLSAMQPSLEPPVPGAPINAPVSRRRRSGLDLSVPVLE